MKLRSLVLTALLSTLCATTAFAAISQVPPGRHRERGWDELEVLNCTASGQNIFFGTYMRKNIITREIVDVIYVNGMWFRETDRVWNGDQLLVEEIYVRSTKNEWVFYSPIEELGVRNAMSRFWKKAGVNVNEKLTCDVQTMDQ
jgi:hypothetical protein